MSESPSIENSVGSMLITDLPMWMRKIVSQQNKAMVRYKKARIQLAKLKLEAEFSIDDLNEKFDTDFKIRDFRNITEEEENEALDLLC